MKTILDIDTLMVSVTAEMQHLENLCSKSDTFKDALKAARNQYSFLTEAKTVLATFPPDYIVMQRDIVMKRQLAYDKALEVAQKQFVREKLKEEVARIKAAYRPQSIENMTRLLDFLLDSK